MKFFKEIDPEVVIHEDVSEVIGLSLIIDQDEGSKWNVGDRNITFHIIKKEKEEEFWPRLLEVLHLVFCYKASLSLLGHNR